jgi:inorganic pyrophosphatase
MTKKTPIKVYIEIEQFSNQKYEWNKTTDKLELDRVLPYPYFYPFAYGFIENTMALDGDELDALIVTNDSLKKDAFYYVYPVGVLVMEDEKGMDEKILCVLEKDYERIKDLQDLSEQDLQNISWFFTNYKNGSPGKWSRVYSFENREKAVEIYEKTKLNHVV